MIILINSIMLLNIIIDEIKDFLFSWEFPETMNCIPFNSYPKSVIASIIDPKVWQ